MRLWSHPPKILRVKQHLNEFKSLDGHRLETVHLISDLKQQQWLLGGVEVHIHCSHCQAFPSPICSWCTQAGRFWAQLCSRFIRSTCGLSSFSEAAEEPPVCRNFGSLSQRVKMCSSPWMAEFMHNAINRDGQDCVPCI